MRNTLFFSAWRLGLRLLVLRVGYRSDQRSGRERSSVHHITTPAGAVQEVEEVRVVGAHEMLSRIRNRPLQLSLVSSVTPLN